MFGNWVFYKRNLSIKTTGRRERMSDSVCKVIELVGTSSVSWEEAAKEAIIFVAGESF
jgi:hypothetical protein